MTPTDCTGHRAPSNGLFAALIIAIVILADQALKIWVKTHFFYGEQLRITDWFSLLFIENNGMAFGMEFGSKLVLTWFRIIAVAAFGYYVVQLSRRSDVPRGYLTCITLITAGAAGNVIDCVCYGLLFDAPPAPVVAQLLPPDGGYATLFNGRVVDMLYFPIAQWDWPTWMPAVGGEHFVFFQPVFNIADASLSVGVIAIILFYSRQLAKSEPQEPQSPDTDLDDCESSHNNA